MESIFVILNKQSKNIIYLLFFATGAVGLIYQIVWFKYLSLFLGNTTYAQMIVLSSFLGGLAFGNYFIGKKIDNSQNPVRIYAWLELSIGVYCLLYPISSDLLGSIFISTASHLNVESQNIIFIILRLIISSALLFIPTFAMGGTLPVLSKFFVDKVNTAQKKIGWLYFLNSLGAVVGVILAGFFLIRTYGLDFTIYSAAIVNIGLGLIALLISKYVGIGKIKSDSKKEKNNRNDDEFISPKIVNLAIVTAGISGMAALLYEMVWVRLLINFLGSSTYAFSIMLAAFIAGIAIGSFIVSKRFINKFNRIKLLIFCQTAIAVGIVFSLLIYERLPYYFWIIASWFVKTDTTFNIFLSIQFLICFGLMFIPTIFMGITLPTVVDIVANSDNKIGFSVGKVFSVNTLGTVLGVFVTTLVLLPAFGIKGSFQIGIVLNLLVALALISYYDPIRSVYKNIISASFIVLFTLYYTFSPAWNLKIMNSGVFRMLSKAPPKTYSEFEDLFSATKVLYYKEGINANVAVIQKGSESQRLLIINGKPDATNKADMVTQIMSGQVPMMLHKNPKNVFVVGFGSGTTIGSILLHPVEKVTCVEISTEVIEASEYFRDVNNNCVYDPRLNIVHEDAHTYLKLSKDKYDVIISEPSNPWIAGIGKLFSKEYFQLCSDKLKDDGIMVQWLQAYETSDEVVQLVLNTFSSVFPHFQIWRGASNDLILVGSDKEISLNENEFKNKFDVETVKQNLELIGIRNPFTFLSTQLLSDKGTFLLAREEPINREKNPVLEFLGPRALYLHSQSNLIFAKDEKLDTLNKGLYIKDYIKENIPNKEDLFGAAFYHRNVTQNYQFCYGLTKYLESESLNNYDSDYLSAITHKDLNLRNIRSTMPGELANKYPESTYIQQEYLNKQLSETRIATTFLKIFSMKEIAKKFIKASSSKEYALPHVYLQLAEGFLKNSEVISAFELCVEIEKLLQGNPQIAKSFSLDRFYYTYAIVLSHLNYTNKYSAIYSHLLKKYPNSSRTLLLKRWVKWEERKN
jgi:spermidine synthase